ncbi:MAG TPA: glycosyltransferase [Gammaproteobacteria bacterium]|nr:glycosyltransferase [Gammaproteobacteria bacterium]
MIHKKKVLISAYACQPDRGSEPGMGWNWVIRLAQHHRVWLITESGFVPFIEKYLRENPDLRVDLHITGVPRKRYGEWLWSHLYYLSYRSWQWQAYKKALALQDKVGFDLVHQLNMIGYREPGYLWKLPVPFVWGPVGGHAQMPWRYLYFLGLKGGWYYGLRNILNWIQMRVDRRVRRAMSKADRIISATHEDQDAIRRNYGRSSVLINEQGISGKSRVRLNNIYNRGSVLRVAWCGLFLERKALPIGLYAIRQASRRVALEFHIIGSGRCANAWKKLARKIGVDEMCVWHGEQPHREAMDIMSGCDVLMFTSLQEGTPAVVTEAIELGLPVICHDKCGFGTIVDSTCGIKVQVRSPANSIRGFAEALISLEQNPGLLEELKKGAYRKATEESWEKRVAAMLNIYEDVAPG